ncbi:MAG: carboxypeptidase regulatory-like domain-containing protein, partial [Paludibacteraceae bacterium]|nr:carboxypeptidase regulatory-like domain-containing protein [Paludibacteraceae bacterium]
MKRVNKYILRAALLVAACVCILPADADNTEFNKESNFRASKFGPGAIWFQMISFVAGKDGDSDHWPIMDENGDCSYVEYSSDKQTWNKLFYYYGHRHEKDPLARTMDVMVPGKDGVDRGVLTIIETSDGVDIALSANDAFKNINAKPDEELGGREANFLRLKWNVPQDVRDADSVYLRCHIREKGADGRKYSHNYDMGSFSVSDVVAPQIYDAVPYLDDNETGQSGRVMVPYISAQLPESYQAYYMLSNGTVKKIGPTVPTFDSYGYAVVQAQDTSLRSFYLEFKGKTADGVNTTIKTNYIDIPAYHRIYNFNVTPIMRVEELKHSNETIRVNTGGKKISWTIKYSQETDVMSADMFEVQRAYLSDFSDATTIGVVPMEVSGSDKSGDQVYSYEDEADEAVNNAYSDDNNLYYRVRRVSASNWGWTGHPYAASAVYNGRIQQMGFDLYQQGRETYFLMQDCDSSAIDLHGDFVWASEDVLNRIGWDERTTIEVLINEQGEEPMVIGVIPFDSLQWSKVNGAIYASFDFRSELPVVCQTYQVMLRLNTDNSLLDAPARSTLHLLSKRRETVVNVTSLTAGRGEEMYPEYTTIAWETDGEPSYFVLTAQDSATGQTVSTDTLPSTTYWVNDNSNTPGVKYLYTLSAHTACEVTTDLVTSLSAVGYRSAYGLIEGQVVFSNGNCIAGATVTATDSVSGKTKTTTTDEQGRFLLDKLEYDYVNGSNYEVTVFLSQNIKFHTKAGTEATYHALLTSAAPAVREVMFYSDSYFRYSGRVLYEGTSIPVKDAHFVINGHIAMHNGDTVRTDGTGNFELAMPAGTATLQVAKDKHVFKNNGVYMYNGRDSIAVNATVDGIRFWDETKVKLTGRVVGGDIQGSLPVGMGLSKNNLGDNLLLVFELEGDNISHFVYDDHDLTKNSRDTVFKTTEVNFKEKRVLVHPDSLTGEYWVELPPTKYRIVQATAEGYATLYGNGKTAETKDLTNSLDNIYTGAGEIYNDTYSVIYHAPATVSVVQTKYGVPLKHMGEKSLKRSSLTGETVTVDVCTETETGCTYAFGYPVFLANYIYSFGISAHEEYYYNNVTTNERDVVPLGNYPVTIYNGFENGNKIVYKQLNDNGYTDALLTVNNTTWNTTGEDALKTINISVKINGQDVQAKPIRGYILGMRQMGQKVMQKIGSEIVLDDVLRDPPGSNSFATLSQGSSYTSTFQQTVACDVGLNIVYTTGKKANLLKGAVAAPEGVGNFAGDFSENQSGKKIPIVGLVESPSWAWTYTYSYSTQENISTSSEASAAGVGANANVFIGHVTNVYAAETESFTVADSASLRLLQPAIEAGEIKVVAQNDGIALVITSDLEVRDSNYVNFTYTQRHIMYHIIPDLVAQMESLLYEGSEIELQALANQTGKPVYQVVEQEPYYNMIKPTNSLNPYIIWTDEVDGYNKLIHRWIEILAQNEKVEWCGTTYMNKVGSYSVSNRTSISHSESASASHNYSSTHAEKVDISGALNLGWGAISNILWPVTPNPVETPLTATGKQNAVEKIVKQLIRTKTTTETYETSYLVETPRKEWTLDIQPIADVSDRGTIDNETDAQTRTVSFTLAQGSDGYVDVDVYSFSGDVDYNNEVKGWRNKTDIPKTDTEHLSSDFMYVLRGGATRCPWEGPTVTEFYHPGIRLDEGTVKIETPHIELKQREISGVPADGVAVFDLTMWIETEANPNIIYTPHDWELVVTDGTNPYGARITIDGKTLAGDGGHEIWFDPGEVLHKTIEVRRGGKAMDYDSIEIVLRSNCEPVTNYSTTNFSVHYVPVSSPVNIVIPHDKWVMNTNSPSDKSGYYLPVTIDGYDPNYENFDHIEFQYKLSTQSEDEWVNQCSYYMDSALYLKANGNKAFVSPHIGKIENIHFYGERDPMEQEYDLRAVSYCRYGTDFIYRSSNVVSGMKDTRRPELFGSVGPVTGILHAGDYVEVPFSEPIAYNYLDEDNNFQVIGIKNKTDYLSRPTLYFNGKASATTAVERSLTENGFSISLAVNPEKDGEMTYITHTAGNNTFEFGQKSNQQLYAKVNGNTVPSAEMKTAMTTFTQVTVTYSDETVYFYAGPEPLGSYTVGRYDADGTFTVGSGTTAFQGRMANVSVWNKTLTQGDVADLQLNGLAGGENGLIAYWPLDEGRGKIAKDQAHGADLTLNGCSWTKPQGKSLQFKGDQQGVQLKDAYFNKGGNSDFTFSMWFQAEPDQQDKVLLFGSGLNYFDNNGEGFVFLGLDENGQIIARQAGRQLTATGNYTDGEWHNLTVVVNRSENYTALYVDGEVADRSNGSFFTSWGLSGNQVYIGQRLKGYIDDLSMWELAMPESYLKAFYTYAPTGVEMGLTCYLPFYRRVLNDYSVYETHYSPYNAKKTLDANGNWVNKDDVVVLTDASGMAVDNSAPICKDNEYEKMKFSWTSRDNDLVINLDMPDWEINHRTIFFSLRDVEDLRGNRLLNPIAWCTYVDRNVLNWLLNSRHIDKQTGRDTTFIMPVINKSGRRMYFTIEDMPNWLQASETVGMMQPEEERNITFTIHKDLGVGIYNTIINLTDQNGLTDQLLLSVTVNGNKPNWAIPTSFDQTMNLVGQVRLPNADAGTYIDTDSRDIVGAFMGNTCVGTANIAASNTDMANLYMKIYGKNDLTGKAITLRLWQANTGKTYVLKPVDADTITFAANKTYGTASKPVVLLTTVTEVQNITVSTGWNWLSFYVQPDDINTSFVTTGGFASYEQVKTAFDGAGVANYNGSKALWEVSTGTTGFTPMSWRKMYMFKSNTHRVIEVEGTRFADNEPRTIDLVHGWNDLPYLLEYNASIDVALADYLDNASEGDIVNGYHDFAMFDGTQWRGSLQAMRTGEGYLLYRTDTKDATLTYYPENRSYRAPQREDRTNQSISQRSGSIHHSTNMPIVAKVASDSIHASSVTAYANGEFVGEATPVEMSDGTTLWFLSAHASEGSTITFVLNEGKQSTTSSTTVRYEAFAPVGNIRHPLMLLFDNDQPMKVIENDL